MVIPMSKLPFEIRRLTAPDADCYRELRLKGLLDHPAAFGASWEEEAFRPLDWFAERLERNVVLGGSWPASPTLAGVAGLLVPETAKLRHKGVLWGVFVRSEAQGIGLGKALLARVLEHAAQIVEEVRLTVGTTNTRAVHLYTNAGFQQYGLEQGALKIDSQYHDEILMSLRLAFYLQL